MKKEFIRNKSSRKGFTLTELLVVIGIIAVVCAIAIPSIMAISRSLSFKQKNDYAKSIFLAAQANLTEMRSDGGLAPLQPQPDGSMPNGSQALPKGTSGFPDADWSQEYAYAVSGGFAYNIILPTNSVDETVRNQKVLVEYNPITGNVYSVFYSEDKALNIQQAYTTTGLPRDDKAARKDMMLGYYCGSGLSSSALEVEQSQTQLTFENGQEGLLTVSIAIPEEYLGKASDFFAGLQVDLTVLGELSEQLARKNAMTPGAAPVTEDDYSFKLNVKLPRDTTPIKVSDDGKSVLLQYPLDSLKDKESFASKAVGTPVAPGAAGAAAVPAAANKNLTEIRSETEFKVLPGENVTILAEVTFAPAAGQPLVSVEPGILAGVNPLYGHLIPSSTQEGKYILGVSNGRNLQNLNILAPTVAKSVETVVFLDDINWNDTVSYYNGKSHGSYANSGDEAPGRCLPYFVPIHHEDLFGTAQFVYPDPGHGGFWQQVGHILEDLFGFNFESKEKVPLLTDELDRKLASPHASIQGNGKKVSSLRIDSDRYKVPTDGKFYATGTYQAIDYNFTGLFGYVNTTVDNLFVVNPIIKGHRFTQGDPTATNPATGGLIGAGGYNTLVTNCGVYIDTLAPDFSRSRMDQQAYVIDGEQNWYGVSGAGAVGGLMGYSKCHRTVTGDLTNNLAHLAFSKSFAAVPVSGYMLSDSSKDLGYTRGVGGFIGNSELTNFYNCYASGNVISSGGLVKQTNLQNSFISSAIQDLVSSLMGGEIELSYNGRTSYGTGGFVGTSHGTRYTNCFSAGTVRAHGPQGRDGIYGAGGFVGVMSYDETRLYGLDDPNDKSVKIAQRTVFDSCYSIGGAYVNDSLQENFSGANARIRINTDDIGAAFFAGDYYRLLAPHRYQEKKDPDYAQWYIFKDSYYLSQNKSDSINSNSNECATVASYDTLSNLVGNHRNKKWQDDRIAQIRELKCAIRLKDLSPDFFPEGIDRIPVPFLDTNYGTKYFTDFDLEWLVLIPVRAVPGPEIPSMTTAYRTQYKEGFPGTYWGAATTATTHAYGQTLSGGVYPFSKLNGMDYYGNWPSRPLTGGLAYYELYEDGSRGIYFDRDSTDNQKLKDNVTIVSDGYAILTSNPTDKVSIRVNGKSVSLTADNTSYTPGGDYSGSTFTVFPIPQEYLKADPSSFYTKLQVSITPKDGTKGEYTFYYNPNMALTQVNPVAGSKKASKPTSVPAQIQIRTARQFRALGTMEKFWTSEYNYYQALDVDASAYRWESSESIPVFTQPVGSAKYPFEGSYTSALDKPAAIRGFLPAANGADIGFFGNIGEHGSVRHLVLDLSNQTGSAAVGGKNADHAGVLAGRSAGTLEDIDILLPQPAENAEMAAFTLNVQAKTSAGLLAGTASGSVRDCHVNGGANTTIHVSADQAGAVLGRASGNTVSASDLTLAGPLTLTGKQAGGFAGAGANASFDSVNVTLDGALTVTAEQAGGLAGALEGGELRSCEVKLNSTAEGGQSVFGGLAGSADTVKAVAVKTFLCGDVSARQAAGLVGTAPKGLSVINSTVTLEARLHGAERSVGAVGDLGAGSDLNTLTVDLSKGSVTSDAAAAGFAGTVNGKISGSRVLLGSDAGKARISGKEAAGFVLTVDGGEVSHGSVSGKGKLKGSDRAAGFVLTVTGENGRVAASFVTPVQGDDSYLGNSTKNLTVSGGTVSGFAGAVSTSTADESNAGLYNCWTLCDLSGNASGFAASNAGKVSGCYANVSMKNGNAFVGDNKGQVSNSYGWFAGTAALPADEAVGYRSCYFADLDPKKGERSMVLFGFDTKAVPDMNAAKLAVSLENLRGPDNRWFVPGAFSSHPFTENMDPPDYPFPMLRDHYGDWLPAPQCAYGVAYYEVYAQTLTEPETAAPALWMHLVDLAPTENSVEDGSLSGSWTFDVSGTSAEAPTAPTASITEAGYVLFCKEGLKPPFQDGLMGDKTQALANVKIPNALETYTFYDLKAEGLKEISGKGGSVQVVTWFADEFDNDGSYIIRTPEQFGNLAKATDLIHEKTVITQERDLTVSAPATVPGFTGTYKGGGHKLVLTNTAPWITDLGGTVSNLNLTASAPLFGTVSGTVNADLTVSGPIAAPVFGTVNGTVTLKTLALDENVTVAQGGALVSTLNGSFTAPAIAVGEVSGNVFGAVAKDSTLSLGSLTAGAVSGSLFGTVDGSIQNLELTVAGPVSAPVFGNVGGTVTLSALNLGEPLSIQEQGALVGTLSGSFTAPGFTLGQVSGNVFDTVSGTLTLDGPVKLGDVSGHFIRDVKSNVTLPAIQAGVLSGSLLENVSAAVTGNTLTATEITAPVVNALTGSLSGLTIENSNLKANVVATADKAKVSGVTVKAEGQALTQPIIGKLNGGSLDSISVTADKAAVTGGVLVTDAGSTPISGCKINVKEIQGSGDSFGILTGTSSGEIKNCTVNSTVLTAGSGTVGGLVGKSSGPLSGNTVTTAMNLAANTTAGGLVGKSSNTLSGNNITATMNLAANTTAGGLAGVASGTVSGGSVQADITYVQPESGDTALIGGILGRMDSGSLEDVKVGGSINLTAPAAAEGEPPVAGSGTGRSYTVGGALGQDGTDVTYTGVTTSVTVAPQWADPEKSSASDPAGQGPVGMFVGEVKDGTFTDCVSTAENGTYQFLGKIAVTETPVDPDTYGSKTQSTEPQNIPNSKDEAALNQAIADAGFTSAEGESFREYAAALSGCTFRLNSETLEQVFQADRYYFQKGENIHDMISNRVDTSVIFTEKTDLTFADLDAIIKNSRKPKPTDFYGKQDDFTSRLYVSKHSSWLDDEYTFSYENGFDFDSGSYSAWYGSPSDPWNGTKPIYTLSNDLEVSAKYLIKADNDKFLCYSSRDKKLLWISSSDPIDDSMLWVPAAKTDGRFSWQNAGDSTIYLKVNDKGFAKSSNPVSLELKYTNNAKLPFHLGTNGKNLALIKYTFQDNGWSTTLTPLNQSNICITTRAAGSVTPPAEPTPPADPAAPQEPRTQKEAPSAPEAGADLPAADDSLPTVSGGDTP